MVLSLKEQIVNELNKLSNAQQEQLLRIVKGWQPSELPDGTPGKVWIDHINDFHFEPGDIDEMMHAIEEDCERIDLEEWQ